MLAALLAQIDLPSQGSGPDDLQALMRISFVLLPVGMVVGVLGHIVRSRTVTAAGIVLVMMGTGVFMIAVARFG